MGLFSKKKQDDRAQLDDKKTDQPKEVAAVKVAKKVEDKPVAKKETVAKPAKTKLVKTSNQFALLL